MMYMSICILYTVCMPVHKDYVEVCDPIITLLCGVAAMSINMTVA